MREAGAKWGSLGWRVFNNLCTCVTTHSRHGLVDAFEMKVMWQLNQIDSIDS